MRADDRDAIVSKSHIDAEETIRRRAYEIYCERGRRPGSELEDWLRAEREVVGGSSRSDAQNRATVIGPANPRQRPGGSSI
jgi:hypothetical protein